MAASKFRIASSSFTGDASFSGSVVFNQDVTVSGTLNVYEMKTTLVSSSIIFKSGSTKFGDTADDLHQFTGSAEFSSGLSGSLTKLVDGTSYLIAGTNVTIETGSNGAVTISSTGGGGSDVFKTISVAGQDDVVADSATDTLTLVAAGGMTITTTAGTDTVTFNSANTTYTAGTGLNLVGTEFSVDSDGATLTTSNADVDHILINDGGVFKRITPGNINISSLNNDSGFTANTGDITGVTAGTGLSGGGSSGDVTINLDFSELTDMTSGILGATEFILLDGSTESRKAAQEINISRFNNDAGYTTNTGDIEGVTAGTGLSGGGSTGTVTLNIDLSELTDMTQAVNSSEDELIILDNGSDRRKLISEIPLSAFNNDSGFTTNVGDITGVTAGTGLSGGGSSGGVTLNIDNGIVATISGSTFTGDVKLGNLTLDSAGNEIDVSSGDLLIDVAGDITLDADGSQVYFKDAGTTRYTFNLDASPQLDVVGAFTIDSSADITLDADGGQIYFKDGGVNYMTFNVNGTTDSISVTGGLTIDASGDVVIDADGGNIDFKDASATHFSFDMDNTEFTIFDDTSTSDYLKFTVAANGASTIATNDNDGTSGNLTLDIDGDITLDADGGTIYFKDAGTTVFTFDLASQGGITKTNTLNLEGQQIGLNSSTDVYIDADGSTPQLHLRDANGGSAVTYFTFNMDSTPELDVTGNFTVDCSGDITLDADGGQIYFKDAGTTYLTFNVDGSTDSIAATGNLTLDASGDITLDAAGQNVYIEKSGVANFYFNAPGNSTGDNTQLYMTTYDNGNNVYPEIRMRRAGGTSSSSSNTASDEILGQLGFFGRGASAGSGLGVCAAAIQGVQDADPGTLSDTTDMPGRLAFFTTPDGSSTLTERMRIESTGDVGIGTTSPTYRLDVHDNTTTFVAQIRNDSSTSGADMLVMDFENQSSPSGQIIYVYGGASSVYRVTGDGDGTSTVSTTFTGFHDTATLQDANMIPGMIVESTGTSWVKDPSNNYHNMLPYTRLCSDNGSSKVFGVTAKDNQEFIYQADGTKVANTNKGGLRKGEFGGLVTNNPMADNHVHLSVMSLGEGAIWITNITGNISNGDLIESSEISGYGRLQSDDIMRSKTVAKCTETIDWDTVTDTIQHDGITYKKYLTSCTFHCG